MTNYWGYWKFSEGAFTPEELRCDDEESFVDLQTALGIPPEPGSKFGLEDQGMMVEVHGLPGVIPSRHRYIVGVNVDGCCERVLVSSLPDLIDLLGKLAPLVSMSMSMGEITVGRE
jgi:hypothetical protein